MNKLIILVLVALALLKKASAQNFIKSYNGSKAICGIYGFKEDSINNKLYMYGNILNTPCGLTNNYIACNQNGNWSFLGPFNHTISSFEIFNNELYACGWFSNVGGQPIISLAKYNGTSWVPVPKFSSAINLWKLKVINNELYVCGGTINTTDGNFNGVAKFNGTNWSGFNVPNLGNSGFYVNDAIYFNNELYLGGNFSLSTGEEDLIYYHNGQWQKPSLGVYGATSTVKKLEVYKNRLYIGGLIFKGEGNVGNMLIAWDGNNLMPVGDGLKDNINSYGSAQVHDMMIFKDKLYIAGTFNYAGNVFSCGLTIFDGNTFCSLNKAPQLSVGLDAVGKYHDTLYISGSLKYLNDSIMNIGKYIGNGTYDTCSVFYDVSIKENSNNIESTIIVFPNPTTKNITLLQNYSEFQDSAFEIIDNLGKVVLSGLVQKQIDVSVLSSGLYNLKIKTTDNKIFNSKFVRDNN